MILLCEDLQWFDGESLAFLQALVEALPPERLLLALTHRHGYEQDWLARCEHVRLRVESLAPARAEDLLARLVGPDPELAELRTLIVERTSGNPFLMEESVRSLVDASVLTGQPGAYTLAEPHPTFEIPGTAEALLTARIDALDPEVKELLQIAAVIGSEIPVELFQRVAELGDGVFRERLGSLRERGMLLESQIFPAPLYRFRHALLQEVAYHSLLKVHRVMLHARVAEAMEALYAGRVGEYVDRLAQHAREGELWEKAVHYHQLASVRAATRWANREAVELIDRGLAMLPRLPQGEARSAAAINLRLSALAPLVPLGEPERMVRLLHEAEEIASASDKGRLGAIYSQMTLALWMSGEHQRGLATGERALAIARAQGDLALQIAARSNLGMVHHALANFHEAIEIHRALLKELGGDLERRRLGWAVYPSVACRAFLGSSLVYVGELEEARAHLEAGCRIADELNHPYSRAFVRDPLGIFHLTLGHVEEALEVFETGSQIARENEVRTVYAPIAGRLALCLAELGRHDEAIRLCEDALARKLHRLGGVYGLRYVLLAATAAYTGAGRYEEALARALELEQGSAASGERAHRAEALLRIGDIQARRGVPHFGEAERAYRQALEICEERGMRPGLARSSFALGSLLRSGRRRSHAEPHLRRARELYAALGMREAAESARKLAEGG